MNLSSIALAGVQQADLQLQSAGSRIASYGANTSGGAAGVPVDLSTAAVALISAKNQYAANIGTLKVADEIFKTTLDVLA
jgi:hypothetical protein